MAIGCLLLTFASAQPKELRVEWTPVKVTQSLFPREMGMLDSEREEYANHLVGLAVNRIREAPEAEASIVLARRMIALALHLSSRNKRAVVANFQLAKGIVPEANANDMLPQSLSRLLLSRGQMLEKQGGDANLLLSRYLYELASDLDSKNEDAIYLSELRRLERGDVQWSELTDPPDKP